MQSKPGPRLAVVAGTLTVTVETTDICNTRNQYYGLFVPDHLIEPSNSLSEDEPNLVVAQFGDRVLPDEWNGVTEVEPPAGDSDQEKLGNGS